VSLIPFEAAKPEELIYQGLCALVYM